MAAAEWLKKIGDAVVATIAADPDLAPPSGLLRKAEQGIIDTFRSQEILGHELPYAGVSVRGYAPASREVPTGYIGYAVRIRIDVADVASLQVTAEQKVRDILATLARMVGNESADRFSLDDEDGYIDDVDVGSGEITEALTTEDETTFMVVGEYTFTVLYLLQVA